MVNLPKINDLTIEGKNVLVRGDFNVDDDRNMRVGSIRKILDLLKSKGAKKIKIIGHTETDFDLASQLQKEYPDIEFDSRLREDPGEKENSMEFAGRLAQDWNVYVNEAFSVSHRKHASVVSLPEVIKNRGGQVCFGQRFFEEVENLTKVFNNPKRPVIMVISGIKEDKLSYVESFCAFADKILIGGRLPALISQGIFNFQFPDSDKKIIIANLTADLEDMTINSIEKFENEIMNAATVVVSGPPGKFEDEGHRQGTKRVFEAVAANKNAFRIAGGGDTEAAMNLLKLTDRFDWVSVGGGAMLEFLEKRTLPGIKAIVGESE